jgi:FxsC-like protein
MGASSPELVPPSAAEALGPGFFLSCARVPPLRGERTEPDYWEKKFFHDLNAEVRAWDNGLLAGFFTGYAPPGADPDLHTASKLATCRIFVPLYGDAYFEDDQCGREWAVFAQRRELRRARTGDDGQSIVPVLWLRQPETDWPQCARSLRPEHVVASDLYVRLGLFTLIRLHEQTYREVVKQIARQIVVRARSEAPPPAAEHALASAVPAFPSSAGAQRRLFITVVAGTRQTIPPDRDPDYYGDQPEQWRPYQPAAPEPLADRAALIARGLGYRPEIRALTATSPEAKVSGRPRQDPQSLQPPGASILLADPWLFQSYRQRRNLETVDLRKKEWVRLMVPWCAADAETAEHRTSLESHLAGAVPWMSQCWRRTCAAELADLSSADQFDEALPAVIDRARTHFLNNSRPLRDTLPAHYSGRPRLMPPPDDERVRGGPS